MTTSLAEVVWLATEVRHAVIVEAERHYPQETGGLLMGYVAPSHRAVVVTSLVGPGPAAVHRPYGFVPDYDFHEREVARLHAVSSGQVLYLGDWHSHPNGSTILSAKDRTTLRVVASSKEARLPTPLMLLVAGAPTSSGTGWRQTIFQGHLQRRRFLRDTFMVHEPALTLFDPE